MLEHESQRISSLLQEKAPYEMVHFERQQYNTNPIQQQKKAAPVVLGILIGFFSVFAVGTVGNFLYHQGILSTIKNVAYSFLPPTLTPTPPPTDTPMPTPTIPPRTPTTSPTPTYTPNALLVNIPVSKMLEGFTLEAQGWNNCGPTTTKMILSYYGITKTQKELATYFRGGFEKSVYDDKHVHLEQVQEYLKNKHGLESIIRVNGSTDKLEALIAHGIPVIVYQQLHVGDDIGHYRIARGYDRNRDLIYTLDSYRGQKPAFSHLDFNRMWEPQNFRYMPVYRPEQENVIRSILGEEYDDPKVAYDRILAYNLEKLRTSMRYYYYLGAGEAYAFRQEWEKARDYYEKARQVGYPERTLWYIHWPLTVYNHLGQYEKVYAMVREVQKSGNKYPGELLYEKAYAEWKEGKASIALKTLETALYYEPNYTPLKELQTMINKERKTTTS